MTCRCERVTFADGDAVRSLLDGAVRVRVAGRWVWATDGLRTNYGDGYYSDGIIDGSMTRVGGAT